MKKVYFLTGHHGVGKTYLVNQLTKEIELYHFDTGPTIRTIYQSLALPYSLGEWIRRGEIEKGENFTDDILLNELKKLLIGIDNNKKIIITGNRNLEGLMYLAEGIYKPNPNIIFLDAAKEILKQNYFSREKEILNNKNFDLLFDQLLEDEINSGLYDIKNYTINHPEDCLYIYKQSNNDNTYQKILKKVRG